MPVPEKAAEIFCFYAARPGGGSANPKGVAGIGAYAFCLGDTSSFALPSTREEIGPLPPNGKRLSSPIYESTAANGRIEIEPCDKGYALQKRTETERAAPGLNSPPGFCVCILGFIQRTSAWRGSARRCPAKGPRSPCPCFPGEGPALWRHAPPRRR